jgi:hypothetical protein
MSERTDPTTKNGKKKPPFSKKVFEQKNERRYLLLQKQRASGLTSTEAEELECLEVETTEYLDVVAPLPFEQLERWEAMLKEATKS